MVRVWLYIRFPERVPKDTVKDFAYAVHNALFRNSSGLVKSCDLGRREIYIESERGHPDEVILALLKVKNLLNDATVSYRVSPTGRETVLHPKVQRLSPPGKLDEMIGRLKQLDEPTPVTIPAPTDGQIEAAQRELGIAFHPDYVKFLREACTVAYGTIELLIVGEDLGHLDFVSVFQDARETDGFPRELFPICEDNSDYYCMHASGKSPKVFYWSHEGGTAEEWPDLATWIEEVWIGEADD